SLHYHFPTKAALGQRLVVRYHKRFRAALDEIDRADGAAARKLQAYCDLYFEVLRRDRLCLCGMLAADFSTLPQPMRKALAAFFDANERWLVGVLEAGRRAGVLRFEGPPEHVARFVIASLEGAMLLARSYGDRKRFRSAAGRLLAGLSATR